MTLNFQRVATVEPSTSTTFSPGASISTPRNAGAFAVSLLAADQDHLAEHFARGVPPIGMWKGVAARDGELGAPLLDGALGWLECRLADEVATGTHTFFVGEVVSAELGEDGVPLVRLGGQLRAGS